MSNDSAAVHRADRSTADTARVVEQDTIRRFTDLQQRLLDHYDVHARSRFVELVDPKLRIHVLEAGAGDPLLIFHGGDGEAVNWAPLMGPLQHHAHILAVDRPGCGLSDPFDYRTVDLRSHAEHVVGSLLDGLGLDRATLVGGSMGGFFALCGALAHPDRVRAVALVGYPAGALREGPLPLRIVGAVPGLSSLMMRRAATMKAQRDQYRKMFHVDPDTVPPLYFETRIAGMKLPSERGTWATLLRRVAGLRGVRDDAYIGDDIPDVAAPVLILWGDHDMAPVAAGRALASRFRNARFEHMAGVGHFPYLEQPDRTSELITAFLADNP